MESKKTKITLATGAEGKEQNFNVIPKACWNMQSDAIKAGEYESVLKTMQKIEVPPMVWSGLPWRLKIENAEMCAEKGARPRNDDPGTVYVDFDLYLDGDVDDELRKEIERRLPKLILESQQEVQKQFPNILRECLTQWYGRERSASSKGRGM